MLLGFVGWALALFRLSIFAGWTFVGDSDRLNCFLNVRLLEVLGIKQHGFVPAWSDQQFMGLGLVGLHWMLPGVSPFPYLVALFPLGAMLAATNAISVGLLVLATWLAYLALRAYSSGALPAAVGALLYSSSSYAILRLAQIDGSFSVLCIIPLLLVGIRETRRSTALTAYLGLTACWAMLDQFTFLQEVAYAALFFGAYTVYRSARGRDAWPLVISGLAFASGLLIGLPRLITVGVDFQELARSAANIQPALGEAFRFFGDGLLGRIESEQVLLRGKLANLHEGVQLLGSGLAALAAIASGLLARSGVARVWGTALVSVLSIVLVIWWRPFYDALGRPPLLSREVRVLAINAVLIGLPLWLLGSWLAGGRRRAASSVGGVHADDDTPGALADAPFFLGFVVVALATMLIPEAHDALYHLFLRVDFLHARISSAMLLPLAALVTILLSRFLPARLDARTLRWLAGGLVLGVLLWVMREVLVEAAVARLGPALEALRPRRLLTAEAVRVVTSLLILLAALGVLVRRAGPAPRTLAGGVLAALMTIETTAGADFRLNGRHTLDQAFPFEALNLMNAPPGQFRVPSIEERAAVGERLEVDHYRVVLLQDPSQFAAHVEPHLSAFWGLRLVEGYSAGLPRRLAALPFDERTLSPHTLDVYTAHNVPWRLLAALNVKYLVLVDRSFWFNPEPGRADPPVDPHLLTVIENSEPVTPRAFFAAHVLPAGDSARFPGDDGVRPAPADPPIASPTLLSVAEGLPSERRFETSGTPAATFGGDRIVVRFEPSSNDRFLVLNELYHPSWQAWVDGQPAQVYPTNLVMRGLVIPAGATTAELRYVPFIFSWYGQALLVAGVAATGLTWATLRWYLAATAASGGPTRTRAVASHRTAFPNSPASAGHHRTSAG